MKYQQKYYTALFMHVHNTHNAQAVKQVDIEAQ